jgi:hypothetical protein
MKMKAEIEGKTARVLTTAEVIEIIHAALKTRVGETFTEAIAFERANNIAQAFTFDGAVVTFDVGE